MSDVDLDLDIMPGPPVSSGSISLSISASRGLELGINKMKPFKHLTQMFGVLSGYTVHDQSINFTRSERDVGVQTEQSEGAKLEVVKDTAEAIALDIVLNFDSATPRNPPSKFCRTMRRIVKDMLERHDMVFKGMLNKLNLDKDNFFQTFVIVCDEIFADGEVNWGRIVAVYAFAVRLAKYHQVNTSQSETLDQEKIAMFLGKYVACKLGKWILTHGGWVSKFFFFFKYY